MKPSVETFAGSKYFELKEVTDGIYAAISVPGSGSLGNAAIVDLGDATLVVDTTMSLEAARDLRRAAEQLTGRPVNYVFNTHLHSDHTHGNQVFAPDAQFISTNKNREMMSGVIKDRLALHLSKLEELSADIDEYEMNIPTEKDEKLRKEMVWEVANDREYLRVLPELQLTLPTVTFDREMAIHGSRRSVQLMTYGGGHSQSDAFLYIPEERLVIIGDLVLSAYHPTMNHANPREWMSILDRLAELDIDTIVPGHGGICSIESLHQFRDYFAWMFEMAGSMSVEEIDNLAVPEQYDNWLFRMDFKSNLKKIRELIR